MVIKIIISLLVLLTWGNMPRAVSCDDDLRVEDLVLQDLVAKELLGTNRRERQYELDNLKWELENDFNRQLDELERQHKH